jgi:peroxiredoxin
VPAVSFVDRAGTLRLVQAAHPGQRRAEGGTVEDWLRAGLAKKAWDSAGPLERYEPVSELVGRAAPDFTLPDIASLRPVRFSDLRAKDRPTVLYFWSVTCPKCVDGMPELAAWWEAQGKPHAALVGVATGADEEMRVTTTRFMTVAGVRFPVLYDRDLDLKPVYRVTTTPTFLLIGTDGTVMRYTSGSRADLPGMLGLPGPAPPGADAPSMSIETAPAPPLSLP